MTDNYKYGTLIAKLMTETISDEEAVQLDEWVSADEQNMRLFEDLTNDYKKKWAKKWFADAGVSTRNIKWKKTEGWYKDDTKRIVDFYIIAAVMLVGLAAVYVILKYL